MNLANIIQIEETGAQGFTQFRVQVPPEFKDIFMHFYFASNKSTETITKTLLPGFQTMIAFNFGEPIHLLTDELSHPNKAGQSQDQRNWTQLKMGKYAILGPVKKAFSYTLSPGAELLILNLKQDGFFRFFGQAPSAADVPLNPDLLTGQGCFGDWWQALSQMKDLHARTDYLLDCCRPYMGPQDKRIARAFQMDESLSDINVDPIKVIAKDARQSIRNTQLQFKKQLGYSAKSYLRNRRFMQAICLIQSALGKGEKLDWFTIIEQCHYFDQSQLIKDFRFFMDMTPTAYLQFNRQICIPQ